MLVLAAAAFFFLRSRGAETAAVASASGTTTPSAVETPTPGPTATATPPVISQGSAPGAGAEAVASPLAPVAAPTRAAPASTTAEVTPPAPNTPAATPGPSANATTSAPQTAQPATGSSTAAPVANPSPATQTGQDQGAGATPLTSSALPTPASGGPDFRALAARLLQRVNEDRAANGLQPVAWDEAAALAAQRHSEEMARFGYMSHWNMDGYGPEYRYSRAGGLDFAQENVYRLVHQWEDGRGAPIENWEEVVDNAQIGWMNSPGHRANILSPEHTHLGLGIAYNPETGNVALAQEFVNRYVTIQPLPRRAQPGDRIVLRGELLPGSSNPLVNLAYEPFPEPMTLEQLNQTGTYTPAAKHLTVPPVVAGADGRFVSEFTLPADAAPGLYHVLMWVESDASPERVLSVNAVIEVSR